LLVIAQLLQFIRAELAALLSWNPKIFKTSLYAAAFGVDDQALGDQAVLGNKIDKRCGINTNAQIVNGSARVFGGRWWLSVKHCLFSEKKGSPDFLGFLSSVICCI